MLRPNIDMIGNAILTGMVCIFFKFRIDKLAQGEVIGLIFFSKINNVSISKIPYTHTQTRKYCKHCACDLRVLRNFKS